MKPLYIIIAVILTILGVGGMIAYKFVDSELLIEATDSSKIKHTVNIGVDNWAGYTILCSKEMRRIALDSDGTLIKCHDDKADYPSRMAKLKSGDLQMAAAEISGYVLAGKAINYSATVQFVIDESQGGDAIIANSSVAKNTNDLKKRGGIRIGFTPNSPSHTLLIKWASDFDVKINDPRMVTLVKTDGSSDAAKKLLHGDIDVAVLWQPDVSKVLANKKFVKIIGSESTKNLIVDALIANDRFVQDHPDVVKSVLGAYFRAFEYYKANPSEFDDQIARYTGIDTDQVAAVKSGIDWIDLPHNGADWLGINKGGRANRQLYDTITSAVKLFVNNGDFAQSPLPNDDPFRLIDSNAFAYIYDRAMAGQLGGLVFEPVLEVKDVSVTRPFAPLSLGKWMRLKDVGSLRIEPIRFLNGSYRLADDQDDTFKRLIDILKTYPNYRIKIVGHTGRRGDKAANMVLSKKRALAVADYLTTQFGIDKNRFYAYGVGNEHPPQRHVGEKDRAYYARWPRVELILVTQ